MPETITQSDLLEAAQLRVAASQLELDIAKLAVQPFDELHAIATKLKAARGSLAQAELALAALASPPVVELVIAPVAEPSLWERVVEYFSA